MSLENRYDFVLLFDVKDGNPNGDPDAGNLPRVDAETGLGLVTDVSLKRKVRNYVGLVKEEKPPYEIYVKEKAILNHQHARAYEESDKVKKILANWGTYNRYTEDLKKWKKSKKKDNKPKKVKKPDLTPEDAAKQWVCDNFFDVRTFGAVMSTSDNDEDSKLKKTAGQVRGPVQITFARSVDPIFSQEHSITVCAARKGDKPVEAQIGIQGRKHTVPYGLYRAHGFISAPLAGQTGFSEEDLMLLWEALVNMFEHDRSAARGEMATRGLYVFKHVSKLGNAHAHDLFDRITVNRKDGVAVPRGFRDYEIRIDGDGLPEGVSLERRLG